jgi:hypothetical protein
VAKPLSFRGLYVERRVMIVMEGAFGSKLFAGSLEFAEVTFKERCSAPGSPDTRFNFRLCSEFNVITAYRCD